MLYPPGIEGSRASRVVPISTHIRLKFRQLQQGPWPCTVLSPCQFDRPEGGLNTRCIGLLCSLRSPLAHFARHASSTLTATRCHARKYSSHTTHMPAARITRQIVSHSSPQHCALRTLRQHCTLRTVCSPCLHSPLRSPCLLLASLSLPRQQLASLASHLLGLLRTPRF